NPCTMSRIPGPIAFTNDATESSSVCNCGELLSISAIEEPSPPIAPAIPDMAGLILTNKSLMCAIAGARDCSNAPDTDAFNPSSAGFTVSAAFLMPSIPNTTAPAAGAAAAPNPARPIPIDPIAPRATGVTATMAAPIAAMPPAPIPPADCAERPTPPMELDAPEAAEVTLPSDLVI